MDFIFYNLSGDMKPHREVHTVLPIIALSKVRASFASHITTSGEMVESELFTKNPRHIANLFVATLTASTGMEQHALKIKDAILISEKLQHKKFKTKMEMLLIAKGKKLTAEAKEYVQRSWRNYSIAFEMHRVNSFIKDGLLSIRYISANQQLQEAEDEKLIAAFQDVVSETNFSGMMVCAENMMHDLGAIELPQEREGIKGNSYLRLKLFSLPGFLSLRKSKYHLMREEMKAELEAWWQALYDVSVHLSGVEFSKENLASIQKTVMEKVEPPSAALRKKMETSIYIQQLSNDEYGEYGSTIYFALTSRSGLLKAYHKTGQLPDKALKTLEEYFGSRSLNNRICCFLYHDVPEYPVMREFDKDVQQGEWDKIWQDSYNE